MKRVLLCPKCSKPYNHVLETDVKPTYIRRRRECEKCCHRWTTYEVSTDDMKVAVKMTTQLKEIQRAANLLNKALQ